MDCFSWAQVITATVIGIVLTPIIIAGTWLIYNFLHERGGWK